MASEQRPLDSGPDSESGAERCASGVELDRKVLHLRALYDTAREVAGLADPAEIASIFLLQAMGPLGASTGFVLLINRFEKSALATARGLDKDQIRALEDSVPELLEKYFPDLERPSYGGGEYVSIQAVEKPDPPLPEGTGILASWTIPGGRCGLVGLGGRIAPDKWGPDDLDLAHNLTGTLVSAVKNALAGQHVRQLNLELAHKNAELEEMVELNRYTRRELDRRVFHLKSLYDSLRELSELVDTDKILESFLLQVMGVFSVRRGFVFLHDGSGRRTSLALRGGDDEEEGHAAQAKEAMEAWFSRKGAKNPIPMSVKTLTDPKMLSDAGLPFPVDAAVVFAADEDRQGVLGLGRRLSGESFSRDDLELLTAHIRNFLVFINNSMNFEAIVSLNRDLEARNKELKDLLEEITQCRMDLDSEKKEKAHIVSLVHTAAERTKTMSPLDFMFIIGLCLMIGLLFNFSNPNGVPLVPSWWTGQAAQPMDPDRAGLVHEAGQALFVDARPAEFYKKKRIKGALNVPSSLFDFIYGMRLADQDPTREIIVYGHTISRHYDQDVADLLKDRGFENVKILTGGLDAWSEQGLPVEP